MAYIISTLSNLTYSFTVHGPDVFVHYTQIEGEGRKQLFENETVEFEIKEGPKGLQALNVRRIAEATT